jgi:hypothetical protein
MIMIRVCADDYRVIMDAIKILRDQERAAQPEGAKENAGAT